MRRRFIQLCFALFVATSFGCAGVRETEDGYFTVHAESFKLFGFSIPEDDYPAAVSRVPEGAEIHSSYSSPADWQSFFGVLGNILGFSRTVISGKKQ